MHTTQFILEADVPNKNHHVYPRYVIETAVKRWKDKQMFGQIDMPTFKLDASRATATSVSEVEDWSGFAVDLNRASHVVENLRFDDNNCLIGDVTVLKTPQGLVLDDLMTIEGLCFRTCGVGKVLLDENGHTVITDYQLLSINAVFDGA